MLLFALMGLAAAAEEPASEEPASEVGEEAPSERSTYTRIYLGGGTAQNQGNFGEALELGGRWVRMSDRIGSEIGGGVSFYRAGALTLPVLNLDAMARWRPSPDWTLQPTVSAGLGLSMLLIIPFPSATFGLGLALPLGEDLMVDATLRGRWIADPYGQTDGVSVATLELGLGF